MKTEKLLGCLAALAMTLHASAQVAWDTNGNTVTGVSEWFGADASSTAPLRIETRVNQPIDWYTNAIRRVTLTPTLVGQTVNGYTGLDLSGHLGVGPFQNPVFTPLAMVHLDSAGTQVTGYRPWMGTGTIMTKLSDMMYVGLKRESPDRNDAVISWADNIGGDSTNGPDRLRFIFTRSFTGATSEANGLFGRDSLQLHPHVFIAPDDLDVASRAFGNLASPTDRLDVWDGIICDKHRSPKH